MEYESGKSREYFGREVYLEIEECILREVLKRPTVERWNNLCAIMAEGVSIAANEIDRNLATRGWLCLGAIHLKTLPLWSNRKNHLPLHECTIDEWDVIIKAFLPLAKSCKYYLERVYPDFDYDTGKWGRAGQEEEYENPLPFFLSNRFNRNEEIICACDECLFESEEDDSLEGGRVFRLTLDFFDELAMLADDEDAELWIVGDFAGNVGIDDIRRSVKEIDNLKAAKRWPPESEDIEVNRESVQNIQENVNLGSKKVFVVHGHDNQLLTKVKDLLQKLNLRPIVLREEPNKGKTIIEKFEYYSHVHYAIVLLTADDIGFCKESPDRPERRGRQNVVLEMGYFMGKYGRDKIVVLCDEGVVRPGDIDGLVYISTSDDWKSSLLRELHAAKLVS